VAPPVQSKAPEEPPKIAKTPETRRTPLYLAFAAGIAVAAAAGFFFRPSNAPAAEPHAQVRSKPALQPTARVEAIEAKTEQPVQGTGEEKLAPDAPLALEQLFPLDLPLAPEDESASLEPEADIAAQLPGGLKLQAVMYAGTKSGLIINGNLLHLGDSINGWEIVAVHEHEVVIQSGEEQRILTIK
jgi:hypothetical protein